MNEMITIDARGYLCPQPLMMVVHQMKSADSAGFAVLVDNETARENICRTVVTRGWTVRENVPENGAFRLIIVRK